MPADEAIFGNGVTIITIEDEAAGEFLEITQPGGDGKIYIAPEEWPAIRQAIDHAIAACGQCADKLEPALTAETP